MEDDLYMAVGELFLCALTEKMDKIVEREEIVWIREVRKDD